MFKTWMVILVLALGAVASLLSWYSDFAPYYAFKSTAKLAVATAASRSQQPGRGIDRFDEVRYEFPLRFTTERSQSVFANAFVPRWAIDRLASQGQINILYLPDDPQSVIFEGDVDRMPRGYGALLLCIAFLVVALAAFKARHGLSRYTKYLGSDAD